MKIIKHIEPPVQDKLKAHYFDRYRPSFDGNKILSSVGDHSEGREIQPGRCYDFDGVDDYVVTDNSVDLFDGDDFYAECYFMVRAIQPGVNQALFGQHFLHSYPDPSQNPPRFGLLININERLSFQYGTGADGKTNAAMQGSIVETGRFYHVKVEFVANQLKMYLDGTEVASRTVSDMYLYNNHPFYIGKSPSEVLHPHLFNGKIFGVKVYSYTRSKYLVFYKMDERSGIKCYDSSGNGNHGTIINASLETFHSTQNIYSWQNEVGHSTSDDVLIPRNEANPSKDVLGYDLEYKGQVAYNALAKQSNCLYLDGIDDIIQFSDTTGWDRLENDGTSELSINGNNIEGAEGSVYNLRVYNSSDNLIAHYPCSEGGGVDVHDVIGNNHGTLVNATLGTVWDKQDEYHYNIKEGYSKDENHVVPASQSNHNQDATGIPLENIAGRHHNGAETLIDFTGGVESPYAVQFELPNNYAFGNPIEYKEEANNIEKNILIYEGVDSGEDIRIKNFIKNI